MAGNEDTGFFRFDTNIDEVVSDIEGGMRRLNSALAGGTRFDQGTLGADTKRLSSTFATLESDLAASKNRINDLLGQVGRGAITKEQFATQLRETIGGAVRGIPNTLAESLASVPKTTALRQNFSGIAKGVAGDYVDELVRTFRAGRPEVAEALAGLRIDPRTFNKDIADVAKNPIAYGNEVGREAQLRNRIRAEELLGRLVKENGGIVPPKLPADIQASGFGNYIRELEALARAEGRLGIDEKDKPFYRPSDALAEMREELRGLKQVNDQAEQTARNVAKAKQEAAGAANYQRLVQQDALGQVTKVGAGTYVAGRGPNAEVFRVTGETAKRVTAELAVREALEAQDRILARELTKSQRLVELDGKRVQRQEANNSGFVGGFLNRFHRGEQSVLTGLGGQLASASAFTFAYGSLFTLQHAITDTIHEFQDYQDSLTDLQVATRDTDVVTDGFVHNLGELARVSGANVGAALDTAARGIRAFGAGAQSTELQKIGEATNEAATKLALIANKGLPDATGDLIASGSAFSLAPDQLNEVVDAVANAKRNVGGDAAQISQGLALIAGGAQEAGFSLNEAAAVIGLVQARTDQSGQAIATRLTRIFQIISGSTGKGLARELGVDANQSVKKQIEDFAAIYSNPDTTEAVRDRITSSLGGTANLRELLPLLKENSTLQAAYAEALSNAGQGTDEFNRKSDNLVGTLKKIQGTISGIQVEFAKSGIAFPLGAAVKAAEPLLHLVERLLQAYNKLPDPLRNTLGVLLDILAVSKAIAVVQGFQGGGAVASAGGQYAAGLVGTKAAKRAAVDAGSEIFAAAAAEAAAIEASTRSRIAAEQRFNSVILAAAAERGTVEGAATGASALGGFRGRFAKGAPGILGGLGSLGRLAINPYVLGGATILGTGLLINKAIDGSQQRNSFLSRNAGAQAGLDRIDLVSTASDLKAASEDVNSAAGNVRKAKSNLFSSGTKDDVAKVLEGQAKTLQVFAKQAAEEESALAAQANKGVFGNGAIETVGQLADGINALNEAGANGITVMRLFAKALNDPVKQGGQIARPDALADVLATGFNANLGNVLTDKVRFRNPYYQGGEAPALTLPPAAGGRGGSAGAYLRPFNELGKNEAIKALQLSGKDMEEFKKGVLEEAARRGIVAGEPISDNQINSLIDYAVNKLDLSDIPETAGLVRVKMVQYWRDQLGTGGQQGEDAIRQFISDVTTGEQGLPVTGEGKAGLLNGRGSLTKDQLLSLFNASADGKYPGLQAILQNAEAAVPASDDGRILEEVRRKNLAIVRNLVKRGGEDVPDVLADLYDKTLHDFAETKINNLERLRKAQQSAAGSEAEVRAIGQRYLQQEISAAGTDVNLLIQIMENADRKALNAVREHLLQAQRVLQAALQFPLALIGLNGIQGLIQSPELTAFDQALGGANTPKKDGNISTGSDSAFKSPEKSREDMKQELLRYRNALDLLKGDLTDPVEAARDAVRAARRQLAAGGSRADRAEARVELRRSRNELEAAKFSQRLSDVQIAEELGKISHSKYIQYLENEHNRLNAIKKRTRQQQDQLNQIDLALKDAKGALDGQFNLGDINTNGLVYQVRRQIAEARANAASTNIAANATTAQQTVTISVNGADTAKVKQIISQYLNIGASQTTTLTRRKV